MEGYFLYITNKLAKIRSEKEMGEPKGLLFREVNQWSFWRAVLAEFVGTMLLVFIGCASTIQLTVDGSAVTQDKLDHTRIIRIGLTFGLMIATMINCFGHVSGGHFNPAVSIPMAVIMDISPLRALMYTTSQCIGGTVGCLLLKSVTPKEFHINLGVTGVNSKLNAGQGIGCECLFTFTLVLCIMCITDSNRSQFTSPAFGIGLTVSVLHFAGIPFSGASMNPARSLASTVVSNSWNLHWVYWVGPILGGCAAALCYKYVFNPYRNTLTMEEAVNELVRNEDMILVPKEFFRVAVNQNASKNVEIMSSHI
ncbi:hypothetical protein CHS0354_015254 [Potamilus streckersoni]|uniref:Aquaporin AQPAe.a n=1 Tax=Potamilus streckersoni TaxID=2493646 RepID=A0AAE0VH95_9BIVA|nr:hypothetical protein CHS0354_015254 [Potamilus streckersoni]